MNLRVQILRIRNIEGQNQHKEKAELLWDKNFGRFSHGIPHVLRLAGEFFFLIVVLILFVELILVLFFTLFCV